MPSAIAQKAMICTLTSDREGTLKVIFELA